MLFLSIAFNAPNNFSCAFNFSNLNEEIKPKADTDKTMPRNLIIVKLLEG